MTMKPQLRGGELYKYQEGMEDDRMRRTTSTLLMISAVILSALLIPTVLAEKPIPVSGTWEWKAPSESGPPGSGFFNVTLGKLVYADCDEKFTGTFEGTGYDIFTMTIHPEGFNTGIGTTLFTGTVLGKSGTLVIQWTGNTKNDLGWWWFKWIILSGTGELANLRGQGTAWGPGPAGLEVWGGVDLSGQIHFEDISELEASISELEAQVGDLQAAVSGMSGMLTASVILALVAIVVAAVAIVLGRRK